MIDYKILICYNITETYIIFLSYEYAVLRKFIMNLQYT